MSRQEYLNLCFLITGIANMLALVYFHKSLMALGEVVRCLFKTTYGFDPEKGKEP